MNRKIDKAIILNFVKWSTLFTIITLLFYLLQPLKTTKVVYIPKGSINTIIHHLSGNGFNVNKLDSFILRFLGHPQSGWCEIGANRLTRLDFLHQLTVAKAAMEKITLIPGETKEFFFWQVAKRLDLDVKKLLNAYEKMTEYKDGVIIADTYHIPKGISESHLVHYLVTRSEKRQVKLSRKIFGGYNKKRWYKYLIVASIVQKEAANAAEMPLVASVVYNRLEKGMKLQMDGSLNYGVYSHTKVTPKRIREDDSRYNTYRYKGLPPDPVGSVSLEAIKAAINPAKTNYLYFVRGADGTHLFASSYRQHLRNIRR